MDTNYTISVTGENGTIVGGTGPVRVLYYLANVAGEELGGLAKDAEVSAQIIGPNGDQILSLTADVETVADVLKSRVARLRKALRATAGNAAE